MVVFIWSKEIFSGYDVEEKFSFEEFIINNFTQLKAMAKIFDGYFIDIGVPSDYEKAQIEMKNFIWTPYGQQIRSLPKMKTAADLQPGVSPMSLT